MLPKSKGGFVFPLVPVALLRTVLSPAFHCPFQLNRGAQAKGKTPQTQQAAGHIQKNIAETDVKGHTSYVLFWEFYGFRS